MGRFWFGGKSACKNANFVATGQNEYSYVGGIAGVCYGSSIKTARLRTPLWRADATTIITVREALWVIPPAEHLKSAPPKTTKLKRWLTAVVLSAKWMMAMESAILHLQTAMLQTVL